MKPGQKFWIGNDLYTVEAVLGASIWAMKSGHLYWIMEGDIP